MSELNKNTTKPRAEHMTHGELVTEFRTLQKWYNNMKEAVNELEAKHVELKQAYNEAVNLNLTLQERVKNQEALLLNEITSNNENKQMLFKRVEALQNILADARKE